MRVYLCGPINGCNDSEANDWRTYCKDELDRLGHTTINPMRRDYRGQEHVAGINQTIVELDKIDVAACDVLLVNYTKPSVGTAMEILFAWQLGKRVAVVAVDDHSSLSPWLTYHAHNTFYSFRSAIKYINRLL